MCMYVCMYVYVLLHHNHSDFDLRAAASDTVLSEHSGAEQVGGWVGRKSETPPGTGTGTGTGTGVYLHM